MNNTHNAKKLPECKRHLSEQVNYNGTEGKPACNFNCQNPFLLFQGSSIKAEKPESGNNSGQHVCLQKLLLQRYTGREIGLLMEKKKIRKKQNVSRGAICILSCLVTGMLLSLLAFLRLPVQINDFTDFSQIIPMFRGKNVSGRGVFRSQRSILCSESHLHLLILKRL